MCLDLKRITVGWGRIGDLRRLKLEDPEDIEKKIAAKYPEQSRRQQQEGGNSLWRLFREVCVGDLVIVSVGRPHFLVEITGDYRFTSYRDPFLGSQQHERPVRVIATDTEAVRKVWREAGGEARRGATLVLLPEPVILQR